jgi:hypothetical protein
MNDANETRETQTAKELRDVQKNADAAPDQEQPPEPGLRARLQAFLNSLQPRQATRADLTKDRTRPLAILIGGTIGAVLLFIAVFSTPPRLIRQESAARNVPNLSRESSPSQSRVPLLLSSRQTFSPQTERPIS